MKRYRILCTLVTGIRGKLLTQGNEYDETEFVKDAIADLVKTKHIEEVKASKPEKPVSEPA